MTEKDKKIKWQTFIRNSLREAENIDEKVVCLLDIFPSAGLQTAIIDMYINIKEIQLDINKEQREKYDYVQFSNEDRKAKEREELIRRLKHKYDNDL